MADRPTPTGPGPDAPEEIEITPKMIEAGVRVFCEEMTEHDYLDRAPSLDTLESIISKIFSSMLDVYPAARRKCK
jgi:hypothetical protein